MSNRAPAISAELPLPRRSNRSLAHVRRWGARLGWERAGLLALLALSALLQGYRLTSIGHGNLYYAAGVRSMLDNWSAFFFGSFDAAGFVTIDKPPAGLWVQAAFAKALGYHGLVLLLPQALAAVGSVALLFFLVRRTFGPVAGLLAALALAVTPISVAASRSNNIDAPLVLVSLLAAWALLRATERGRVWPLLLCAALVGVGFNIKMLQAYLVVPAFALVYLLASPARWLKRIEHLLQAGAVLAVVSLSWALVVEVVPADRRPYIGSSQENSAIELAFGYNGMQRLLGVERKRPPGARPPGMNAGAPPPGVYPGMPGVNPAPSGQMPGAPGRPPGAPGQYPPPNRPPVAPGSGGRPAGGGPPFAGPPPYAGAPGGVFPPGAAPGGGPLPANPMSAENGAPGPLRLFNDQLGAQIAWLLPLAVLGAVVAWGRPRLRLDGRQAAILLWAMWLLTGATFFSAAEFMHTYYLTMIGPPIAALAGIGAVALWERYRAGGRRALLLPAALLVSAAVQVYLLRPHADWSDRLTPLILGGSGALALVLVAGRLVPRIRPWVRPSLVAAAGVVVVLAAPAVWAAGAALERANPGLPRAYAPGAGRSGGPTGLPPGGPPRTAADPALLAYLERNQGSAVFLAGTSSAQVAAPLIIATGRPVMAMGGFSGNDPILTVDALKARIAAGEVRYFLGGGGGAGQVGLMQWIVSACTHVPPEVWRAGSSPASSPPPTPGPARPPGLLPPLYDCGVIQKVNVRIAGSVSVGVISTRVGR